MRQGARNCDRRRAILLFLEQTCELLVGLHDRGECGAHSDQFNGPRTSLRITFVS